MILLDENITETQRHILRQRRIRVHQIGEQVGRKGIQDSEIITLLLSLPSPTFFTRDDDFYARSLRHSRYCLVFLDVAASETALYVRKLLRHPDWNTFGKRRGRIARTTHAGIYFRRLHDDVEQFSEW